jgi:hypothetical protein
MNTFAVSSANQIKTRGSELAGSRIDPSDAVELLNLALSTEGRVTPDELEALTWVRNQFMGSGFDLDGLRFMKIVLAIAAGQSIATGDVESLLQAWAQMGSDGRDRSAAGFLLDRYGWAMTPAARNLLQGFLGRGGGGGGGGTSALENAITAAKRDWMVDLNEMVGFFEAAGHQLDGQELELINRVLREARRGYQVTEAASGGADLMKQAAMGSRFVSASQAQELIRDIESSPRRFDDRAGAMRMMNDYNFQGDGAELLERYLGF